MFFENWDVNVRVCQYFMDRRFKEFYIAIGQFSKLALISFLYYVEKNQNPYFGVIVDDLQLHNSGHPDLLPESPELLAWEENQQDNEATL